MNYYEDGVNGSDYYECNCGLCYNVVVSRLDNYDDDDEEEDYEEDE